jgi:CheY-like chemotaxis protein
MPKTLLLADDSVTIQKVVGISFANEDIVLLTVDNGDDAIARCREARPDIVLADVVMPGKNGYDVCQTIKSDPSLAHIPVLLLTGTFEAFDEQRAARAGADGHITKPFEAQALVDQVNGLLSRPAPSAGAPAEAAAAPAAAPAKTARPAPPQPVSHTADTAYDFFEDDATATRDDRRDASQEATVTFGAPPVATPAATPAPAPAFAAPPAEPAPAFTPPSAAPAYAPPSAPASFDASAPAAAASGFGNDALDVDSSFSGASLFDDFGGASSEAPTATAAPRVDPTPSEPIGWGARSEPQAGDSFDWDVRGDEATGTATSEWDAPAAEPSAADNGIDFEANTQPDPPPASAGWDLASDPAPAIRSEPSEVPDWFTPASEPASASYPPEVTEAPSARPETFDLREPSSEAFDLREPSSEAFDLREPSSGGFDLEASLDESSTFGDAVIDPQGARDYDVSSSDLGAPVVLAPLAEPPPAQPAPAPAPAASFGAPAAPSFASAPAAALPERDRREIHDALEKVAWEAFGPVAESLVREAVERIERIAWEVIPQLAESLIKEEIRKLKGE